MDNLRHIVKFKEKQSATIYVRDKQLKIYMYSCFYIVNTLHIYMHKLSLENTH